MIEKLGHSKRIQTMRREWIDEEKPKPPTGRFESVLPERSQLSRQPSTDKPRTDPRGLNTDAEQSRPSDTNAIVRNETADHDGSDDGELFMPDYDGGQQEGNGIVPEDDDLDILLREQDTGDSSTANKFPAMYEHSDDGRHNDDLEALRELEDPGAVPT